MSVARSELLDRGFLALSHPGRRALIERLASGPAPLGVAARGLGMSKPALTKHLRALEEAGLVHRSIRGREHIVSLNPESFRAAAAWLERQRARWTALFETIDLYLEEQHGANEPDHPHDEPAVQRAPGGGV
jgi:DNA-binding transcriptional ArsR family regulator